MTTYKIPEDVIITEIDGNEAILLDMRNKRYYSLNETGFFILKGIEQNLADDEIISKITSTYDVDYDKAKTSVKNIINKLLSLNIIEEQ